MPHYNRDPKRDHNFDNPTYGDYGARFYLRFKAHIGDYLGDSYRVITGE